MYPETPVQELRREPRRPAEGAVTFRFEGKTFKGQLVDTSPSGFRARHEYPELVAGLTVRFSHPEGTGRARIVWNRIFGVTVESGFLILER